MMNSVAPRVKGLARPSENQAPPPPRRIPFAFRADPVALDSMRLDPTARALFVLVLDNAKDRGWRCRLSNATMGRILGRCPMTISRALGRLESAGLIRRETAAGGRVRLAIHVAWDGVRRDDEGVRTALRREGSTGSARPSVGLGAAASHTHIPPIQTETSDADRSSLVDGEDAASRVASGPEAAAYLRACVEAGRRGEPMPPPPGVNRGVTGPESVNTPLTPPPPHPAPTPATVPPGVALADVGRMVRALGDGLKSPDAGRRRPSPARLARMLGEARKRRAGKAHPPGVERRSMTDVAGALSG